jgi:hypothetical protein
MMSLSVGDGRHRLQGEAEMTITPAVAIAVAEQELLKRHLAAQELDGVHAQENTAAIERLYEILAELHEMRAAK